MPYLGIITFINVTYKHYMGDIASLYAAFFHVPIMYVLIYWNLFFKLTVFKEAS